MNKYLEKIAEANTSFNYNTNYHYVDDPYRDLLAAREEKIALGNKYLISKGYSPTLQANAADDAKVDHLNELKNNARLRPEMVKALRKGYSGGILAGASIGLGAGALTAKLAPSQLKPIAVPVIGAATGILSGTAIGKHLYGKFYSPELSAKDDASVEAGKNALVEYLKKHYKPL